MEREPSQEGRRIRRRRGDKVISVKEEILNNLPLTVLHIIGKLPYGGAENLLLTLSRYLPSERICLKIICLTEDGPIADSIRKEGVDVYLLKQHRMRAWYCKYFQLNFIIRKNRPHIVHTHLYEANFWGRLVAILAKVPVVVKTEHAPYLGKWSKKRKWFYNIINIFGIQWLLDCYTDATLYISKSVMRSYKVSAEMSEKDVVIYNAVDEKRMACSMSKKEARKNLGLERDDLIIVSIARFVPDKGHKYLFHALSILKNKYRKIRLLLVGDGPIKKDLEVLVQKYAIEENIQFMGVRDDVSIILRASDIFVLATLFEGFGLSVAEAMLSGVPVISTKVGGIVELVGMSEGARLVNPGDPQMLAEAIIWVLQNPGEAEKMARRGMEHVKAHFLGKRFAMEHESIYNKLMTHVYEQNNNRS